ncbi:MAG: hypothetical protein ABW179_12355 [Methylobacterium sp.]
MPRYFFDIHDGIHVTDDVGRDLPDLEAAKAQAIQMAGGFATRPAILGDDGGALNVVVRTAPDVIAMTIRLVFNVEIPRDQPAQGVAIAPGQSVSAK